MPVAIHRVSRAAWKELGLALGIVVLLATLAGFVGYAAAVSLAAWRQLEDIDKLGIAQQAFLTTGGIGIPAAILFLIARG